MEQKEHGSLVIRIHQFLIMVVLVFSLFVKPEVKKVFWLVIGMVVLSLVIQELLKGAKEKEFEDRRHEV